MQTKARIFSLVLLAAAFWTSALAQDPTTSAAKSARDAETRAQNAETSAAAAQSSATASAKSAKAAEGTSAASQAEAEAANKSAASSAASAEATRKVAEDLGKRVGITRGDLDRLWVLLAAVLVFFMQAGFKCLEVGTARFKHNSAVGVMNLMNWVVLCVVFYLFGYGLMFGYSDHFLVWNEYFFPGDQITLHTNDHGVPLGLEFLLFQLAFAATTATIVDGAVAERMALTPYIALTVLVGGFVYPLFGHWAWNDHGWLNEGLVIGATRYRFHDFAGSTVVHSVGAWIALAGIRFTGPRRFLRVPGRLEPYSLGYSVLGAMLLWFGWWGFNGGSTLQADPSTALIILNTNLAGAAGGLAAYLFPFGKDRSLLHVKFIGGVLVGLVAITASCDASRPLFSLVIGATAGLIHNISLEWLRKAGIDDVAGAVAVHGPCGVVGTLMASVSVAWATWTKENSVADAAFKKVWAAANRGTLSPGAHHPLSRFAELAWFQFVAQVVGILLAYICVRVVAAIIFTLLEQCVGLRTSIQEEDGSEFIEMELARYQGGLHVSEKRNGFAWTRFRSLAHFMHVHQGAERTELEKLLCDQEKVQVIRDDDTPASKSDIVRALNPKPFFLCYRQADRDQAALVHAILSNKLREDHVYMDKMGGIAAGDNWWADHIRPAIRSGKRFLLVIGPEWLDALRPDDPTDFVYRELKEAMDMGSNTKIMPLLVRGAARPTSATPLPTKIQEVLDRLLTIQATTLVTSNGNDRCWDDLASELSPDVPRWKDVRVSMWRTVFGLKPV